MTTTNKYKDLDGYLDSKGRFECMPGKRQKKKQALLLQFLAEKFVPGKKYSEKEVNELLNRYHTFKDPASLRRFMFGSKLLDRTIDGRSYWLVASQGK